MARYLVTFESCQYDGGNDCTVVVPNRSDVDEIIKQWSDDGYMDDGEMPIVYKLGTPSATKIETKITLSEDTQ